MIRWKTFHPGVKEYVRACPVYALVFEYDDPNNATPEDIDGFLAAIEMLAEGCALLTSVEVSVDTKYSDPFDWDKEDLDIAT